MNALRIGMFLLLAASSAAFAGVSARAGAPQTWARVTPVGADIGEVGLARTPDGTLHLIWTQDDGATESLRHRAIAPGGRAAGATTAIVAGWRSLNSQPALAVAPDGRLHAVFAGLHSTRSGDPLNAALHSVEGAADGRRWSGPQRASRSNTWGYAASGIGAGVTRERTLVVAQGDSCPGCNLYRFAGSTPASPDVSIERRCCVRSPEVAVDGRTAETVLGWNWTPTGGKSGIYAQVVSPTRPLGRRFRPPDSSFGVLQGWGLTGRSDAPGVFAAYLNGTGTAIRLWRFGSRRASTVATGTSFGAVGIARASDGRIWVFWESEGRYSATRSNRAATRFGPILTLEPPQGLRSALHRLGGEGTRGPLDLVARLRAGGRSSTWHTQLLARLTLACTSGKPIRCRVSDAGDAVSGATVRIGTRRLLTNAQGEVSVRLPAGTYRAEAAKVGYAPAFADVKEGSRAGTK